MFLSGSSMQNRYSALVVMMLAGYVHTQAQTTWLPLWAKEQWLLDRMEIKLQRNNDLNLSTVKPYMRKLYVELADSLAGINYTGQHPLTETDRFNLHRFRANSSEFSGASDSARQAWQSRRPWGNSFFKTQANLLELDKPGAYVSINPALTFQQGVESESNEPSFFRSLGLNGRGLLGKRLGFQFLTTLNEEAGPLPFRQFIDSNGVVPGVGRFKTQGEKYQYFDFRGSLSTNVTKYIQLQFGYDQQFIGNGYRSLLLSHFSNSQLFFKINTRIWKLNYTNWFMQLRPTPFAETNKRLMKKYTSMHHLGINVTPWLNLGVFEAIVFGRENGYDPSYLSPLIFLRAVESNNGSPDNANVGFDFKANVAKKFQFYGQLMLDEFVKNEAIGGSRNWWGNKQAIQLGAKYADVLGVSNLDLQLEMNQVRPFMYQFRDTTGAYTNFLQPLAHPLGGNLREFVAIVRYQPLNRLYLHARLNVWKQGMDSAGYNFGANPNDLYNSVFSGGDRLRSDNYPLFAGTPVNGLNTAFTASYELKENLFAELQALHRRFQVPDRSNETTTSIQFIIRWNMFRREYDY
jgi:hypothetical protein